MTGLDVVTEARRLLGTPFHHLGRLSGVGVDCAGLLIVVARKLGLVSPDFDVPPYSRSPDGNLIPWCDKYMKRIGQQEMRAGDAIVVSVDRDPQHLGLLSDYKYGGFSIIHAHCNSSGVGKVIETRLMFARNLKFVAAYRLPGIA